MSTKNLQYRWNGARLDQGSYDELKSHIRASVGTKINDLGWPWTAETSLVEIKKNNGAHQKNFNEDRPILSAAECLPVILVSRNRVYADIRGVPRGWAVKYNKCYTCVQTFAYHPWKISLGIIIVWSSKFLAKKIIPCIKCLYRAHCAVIFAIAQLSTVVIQLGMEW